MKLYIGIDWSEQKHDVMFLNEKGGEISYKSIAHSQAGFEQLDKMRAQLGVERSACIVGLETAHNLVIDYLWHTGYSQVYVLVPNTVHKSRGRYRQSGASNDRSDAYVIADLLRTDRHRFYPWHPGSALLCQMRAMTSAALFWRKEVNRLSNRLRTVLRRYYPAALATFTSWPSQIVCHLIRTYPTPQAAQAVTWSEFKQFAQAHRYTHTRRLLSCYDRLKATYPAAAPAWVAAYAPEAGHLAEALLHSLRTKQATLAQLNECFQQHPDRAIFASLPGAGELLAPALLVKFGEDRQRFPTPAAVQALAGTCPVTRQSGKSRIVLFRRTCDKSFRYFAQQFARTSVAQSLWAPAYFEQVSARVHSEPHAYRCLANRWLAILWKCWQDGKPYDEAYHLQQRAARREPVA